LQGCWRISDFFSLAVSSALGVWILPRVSADVPRERLPEIVLPVLGRTVALAAAGALAVWALRGLVVPLLFSESFGAMEELLPLQLAGDAVRSAGWCLGLVLMARRRTKLFISGEIVSQLFYAAASLALLPLLGIRGPLVAYLAENALYAAALFVLLRRVR
ncbi:MAG: O-antigen translocase, partial [Fibrobacterales bacterium]|nr:O-antigen translocase [Fibrobacterales bacterium]